MSAEFDNQPSKPPDQGNPAGERPSESAHLPSASSETQGATGGLGRTASSDNPSSGPPPFAGGEPAVGAVGDAPDHGGEGRKPSHLHPVGSPQQPDEGLPPATKEEAEIERERVETDTIRARNEAIRSDTTIKKEKAASEIENADNLSEAEFEAVEVDTRTTQHERYFFMALTALGVLITAISAMVSGLTGQPLFFTGSGVGLLATGGGLRRLGVLTSPRRRKTCLLGRKSQQEKEDDREIGV